MHPILFHQKVGQLSTLVSEVFAITQSAVKSMTVSKRTSADEFLKNLSIDKNDKVQVFNRYCQNPHTVTLNRYHKCSRGQAFF